MRRHWPAVRPLIALGPAPVGDDHPAEAPAEPTPPDQIGRYPIVAVLPPILPRADSKDRRPAQVVGARIQVAPGVEIALASALAASGNAPAG